MKLFYVNSKGQNANATLANIEDILPTITFDDSLKDENTQQPKWDELLCLRKIYCMILRSKYHTLRI